MHVEEALVIFPHTCGYHNSNCHMQNNVKHSRETISKKLNEALHTMIRFSRRIVQPCDSNFQEVLSQILKNYKYWPHFRG